MSATAGQAQDERGQAERLGIKPGQVVQEIGHDDDCDEQLRDAISRIDGVELVDEDYDDVVDVVLLWWRDGDGDLVDALVDALTPLFQEGWINSLKIIQLIAFVEVLRGENIPDSEIVMDRFQNVRAICEHFLTPIPVKCI